MKDSYIIAMEMIVYGKKNFEKINPKNMLIKSVTFLQNRQCIVILLYRKSGREEKICQQILSRESIQPVKVTDETGKKCTLKLAKLNEKKDTGVYFREADPTSVFGQIDNGHYYYLKSNSKREYKIF